MNLPSGDPIYAKVFGRGVNLPDWYHIDATTRYKIKVKLGYRERHAKAGTTTMNYMVIRVDNYRRDTVAERCIMTCNNEESATKVCKYLQDAPMRSDDDWYTVVPETYRLWRGMEEFV